MMAVYENKCGDFEIRVSEPHPAWVTIKCNNHREGEISGFDIRDLYDLQYLIHRAILAAGERGR